MLAVPLPDLNQYWFARHAHCHVALGADGVGVGGKRPLRKKSISGLRNEAPASIIQSQCLMAHTFQ